MYVLFTEEPSGPAVIEVLRDMYTWIANYSDEKVPGATEAECGNYRDHDLAQAKKDAQVFLDVLGETKNLGQYVPLTD